MKNNDLKIGDIVILKDGDPIAMVIEEIYSDKDKRIAKCVWFDIINEVVRAAHSILSLELERNRNFDTISHVFKIGDYVVLKSGEYSMIVEGLSELSELSKVTCSWLNTSNELQVETFYSTSLIPE